MIKTDSGTDFQQHVCFKVRGVHFTLVYRSPNALAAAMEGLVELVKGAPKGAVLLGDFNLPDVNWSTGESSSRARPLVNAVDDAMMEQMVNFSTQVRGSILDLVLTNIPERVFEVTAQGRLANSDQGWA